MKYYNLIGEMAKNNITIEEIAELLCAHRNTVAYKLNGGAFKIEEAFLIRDAFFPSLNIEELFKKESVEKSS